MSTVYKVKSLAIVTVPAQAAVAKTKKTPAKAATPQLDGKIVRWASAEGAAKQERRAMMEAHGLKMADVEITKVDVPTSKAGIIEWLNQNLVVQ